MGVSLLTKPCNRRCKTVEAPQGNLVRALLLWMLWTGFKSVKEMRKPLAQFAKITFRQISRFVPFLAGTASTVVAFCAGCLGVTIVRPVGANLKHQIQITTMPTVVNLWDMYRSLDPRLRPLCVALRGSIEHARAAGEQSL
mmetsp:Transcript_24404/g.56475  ORF Transcript_24404/g.56475 Transcript_24404/m.56475 type:complete len:141 (+) Transcript_24404:165-587(+)